MSTWLAVPTVSRRVANPARAKALDCRAAMRRDLFISLAKGRKIDRLASHRAGQRYMVDSESTA